MAKSAPTSKPTSARSKNLKDLFEDRDNARVGSKEEREAVEKILETIFPDTHSADDDVR
jgi:hypothetical protein